MNHIVLIGRLTRDPELRYTPNGVAVANFDLAVDRPVSEGRDKETDFIHIVVWQKRAETCANYLKKGRLVAVEGRLQIRSYETQEGQKRNVAEVVASNVQFLERARDESGGTQSSSPASGSVDKSCPHCHGEGRCDYCNPMAGINLDDLPF